MPLLTQVKFDPLLTNISIQFQPAQGGYLADMVAPPVRVRLENAVYWQYDKSRFDVPDALRAPRSRYNQVEWTATRESYSCEEYGLEEGIDDRERANAAAPLSLEVDTTEILTDMILNNREARIVAIAMSTTFVTNNSTLAGTAQWSDRTSGASHPLDDAKTARTTIFDNTGYRPNTLAVGYKVDEELRLHPDILERITFTSGTAPAVVDEPALAKLFDVANYFVGGVLHRTSNLGQTDVLADRWGNDALFFYREMRPSLKRASFMYQMRQSNLKTFRYRDDQISSDMIRVTEIADEKLVSEELAFLYKSAIA